MSLSQCSGAAPQSPSQSITIKNTFLDVSEQSCELVGPSSQSCPAAAFRYSASEDSTPWGGLLTGGSEQCNTWDITAAAQMFSALQIPREVMESHGYVDGAVAATTGEPVAVAVLAMRPPPLFAPDLAEAEVPEAPMWSPKVGPTQPPLSEATVPEADVIPEAPAWSPKVSSLPRSFPSLSISIPCDTPKTATKRGFSQEELDALSPPDTPEPCPNVWYRVAHLAGLPVYAGPNLASFHTGALLHHNEIFAVSQEIPTQEGMVCLRLADGRGFVFDDSAILPQSPSVIRGSWMAVDPQSTVVASPLSALYEPTEELLAPLPLMTESPKGRRRRKRGGVKRNKSKRNREAQSLLEVASSGGSEADAETEVPSSSDAGDEEEESPSEVEEGLAASLKMSRALVAR